MPTPEEIRKRRKLDEEAIKLKAAISEKGMNVNDRLSPTGSFNTNERNQDIKNTQSDMDKTPPPFIIDQETGKVTGITRNGKTFFLPPEEIEAIQKKEAKEQQITDTAILANQKSEGAQREKAQAQLQRAQEFQNMQDVQPVQPSFQEPGSKVNVVNEIGLAAGITGGAVGGAKMGAALTPFLGPLGIIGLGILGGIGGAITVLTLEERQNVKKGNEIFTNSKTNKDKILNQINAGLMTETAARQAWALEKANIALSQSYLKKVTNDDLKEFLGNPGDELIAVESYLELDSQYDIAFESALLNPDDRKIIPITTPQET